MSKTNTNPYIPACKYCGKSDGEMWAMYAPGTYFQHWDYKTHRGCDDNEFQTSPLGVSFLDIHEGLICEKLWNTFVRTFTATEKNGVVFSGTIEPFNYGRLVAKAYIDGWDVIMSLSHLMRLSPCKFFDKDNNEIQI